jgi:hypothetical protein
VLEFDKTLIKDGHKYFNKIGMIMVVLSILSVFWLITAAQSYDGECAFVETY